MPQTVFDDGSSLAPLLRADLLDIALRHTLTIDTLAGDVLVIDNWRVMHGRTAFDDPRRKMCIRMGYLDQLAEPRFSAGLEEIEY
jgi:alpha-ketoglutarate-dependent taurine dioxygenase